MKVFTYEGWLDVRDDANGEKAIFLFENQKPSRHDVLCEEPLFKRITEETNFRGEKVFVRWWAAGRQATRQELSDDIAMQALGAGDCKYYARFSDLTGYLWTDNWFKVGDHDIKAELETLKGMWVLLEIEVAE